MTIDGLASQVSVNNTVSIAMLGQGLDQQASQVAQLLQGLPAAPQPAHLGRGVDVYA